MGKIEVLDCTLRDGGYCNNWNFGKKNIYKIIKSLLDAKIDVIECGFLNNTVNYNSDRTQFSDIRTISAFLPFNSELKDLKASFSNTMFVAMINFGQYNPEDLPEHDNSLIDGIRIAFHKKDRIEALKVCDEIINKGYKVFIQPMYSMSYSDTEFVELINLFNDINPYAFYIVDSFGTMKKKELMRFFYLCENNLKDSIKLGFHSHNNLQLAYSNSQDLLRENSKRNLIIDSSVYGMGRGAGNLNSELFLEYLNENYEKSYNIKPLLNIIDEVLNIFYEENHWGYSLPNYLSASHMAHPNYGIYYASKNTLTVQAMDDIFSWMPDDKKIVFDKDYAEELYLKFMTTGKTQLENLKSFQNKVKGKTILLIAPGKSAKTEEMKIISESEKKDVISVSINYDYDKIKNNMIFLSNLKRYKELPFESRNRTIVTDNISGEGVFIQTKYYDLINSVDSVKDNAGMMAIKFFINLGASKILLAGFDGYSHDISENYALNDMTVFTKNAVYDAMNEGMKTVLSEYSKKIEISFLTKQKFVYID